MKALVVDGYNAIYKIPHIKRLMDGRGTGTLAGTGTRLGTGLSEARKAISELARQYARRCGGIGKIRVVFDGKDEFRDKSYIVKSTDEIFSKSGCGDSEIIRVVRELSNAYDVIVVSDDNFVRNNSRAQKATVIAISEFAALAGEKKLTQKDTPRKKIDAADALEINKELKAHWKL